MYLPFISILFSNKDLYYCLKKWREVKEFGKLKIKFIKISLPEFTNKTKISEGPSNTTKRLTKTSSHSLQHLIQMTLIFIALLNPWSMV